MCWDIHPFILQPSLVTFFDNINTNCDLWDILPLLFWLFTCQMRYFVVFTPTLFIKAYNWNFEISSD